MRLGHLAARRGDVLSLLAGPRFVSPGEKDESEFGEDVRVGDVEIVF